MIVLLLNGFVVSTNYNKLGYVVTDGCKGQNAMVFFFPFLLLWGWGEGVEPTTFDSEQVPSMLHVYA